MLLCAISVRQHGDLNCKCTRTLPVTQSARAAARNWLGEALPFPGSLPILSFQENEL